MPGFEWFGDEERQEVSDVLETGVLFRFGFDQARKNHWKAKTFEKELADRMGIRHALLCSSGTAALSIALSACGIGAGDEVIVPPFTFIATVESVLNAGAVPVFADIDETLCLDPKSVEARITSKTKAVLPVHMCGAMARIDEIADLCTRKGLMLIEDACQSVGASYRQKALGTFGQMGCFSFDAVKTITCGEGGAVITDDKKRHEAADAYADHGHDHVGSDRGLEGHPILGANYRISELNAAVGLAQLRKLDRMLAVQRQNKAAIAFVLKKIPGLSFRLYPDEAGDSATFLSFFLPDEAKARKASSLLAGAGVDGCFYWFDNNWHYFRKWDHLKNLSSAARLPLSLLENPPDYKGLKLTQSDSVMCRLVCMQIKLAWNQEDLARRMEKMENASRQV